MKYMNWELWEEKKLGKYVMIGHYLMTNDTLQSGKEKYRLLLNDVTDEPLYNHNGARSFIEIQVHTLDIDLVESGVPPSKGIPLYLWHLLQEHDLIHQKEDMSINQDIFETKQTTKYKSNQRGDNVSKQREWRNETQTTDELPVEGKDRVRSKDRGLLQGEHVVPQETKVSADAALLECISALAHRKHPSPVVLTIEDSVIDYDYVGDLEKQSNSTPMESESMEYIVRDDRFSRQRYGGNRERHRDYRNIYDYSKPHRVESKTYRNRGDVRAWQNERFRDLYWHREHWKQRALKKAGLPPWHGARDGPLDYHRMLLS